MAIREKGLHALYVVVSEKAVWMYPFHEVRIQKILFWVDRDFV